MPLARGLAGHEASSIASLFSADDLNSARVHSTVPHLRHLTGELSVR